MTTAPAKPLMLVSASADEELRAEVANGLRPRPEYLVLEQQHGVDLLDWSRLPGGQGQRTRSTGTTLAHVAAAMRVLEGAPAVLSDGEHLGIPLSLAMLARRRRTPHLVIGHHLDTASKRAVFRGLGAGRRIDRILVHSARQRDLAVSSLGVDQDRVTVLPYAVDTDFWEPGAEASAEHTVIATAGIEHRDYATLCAAMLGLDARLVASIGSLHSPASQARLPERWPDSAVVGFAHPVELRQRYAEATIVAVPVVETEFPAGITTVLEAMAMGRPLVVTGTRGLHGIVRDGDTGLVVPPGDAGALHQALSRLLDDAALRHRLGARARAFAVSEAGIDRFATGLAQHLEALSAGSGWVGQASAVTRTG